MYISLGLVSITFPL